jgi:malectin (di-glucose binding ER protein)
MCRSTDHGLTWTTTGGSPCKLADESEATNHWDWSSPSQCPNNLPYCGFTSPGFPLQFGKDYQGARDGYVYYYIDESPNILLARVLKDQMMNRNQWQFFSGLNSSGSPTWSSNTSDRQPVFTDAVNGIGWVVSVIYHPILHRYLLTTRPVGEFTNSSWGLFDAPEPWGPWTTVTYQDSFRDSTWKFMYEFNQKWMSANDLTLWMVSSGIEVYDSFNVIKATLSGVPPGTAHAINAGGGTAGLFGADTGYSGGYTYATSAWIDTSQVSSPAPQKVYQTERWFGDFSYTMSGLSAGSSYTVRLHFAEIYWSDSGWRLFNVAINDSEVLNSFDIFHEAGGANRGIVREFGATADGNGQIRVSFSTILDAAKVSGIEILDAP